MWIFAICVALVLGLFGFRYVAVRFGNRYYSLALLCAAIPAAIVALVVMINTYHSVLERAQGDWNWDSNELVRGVLIFGPPLVVGYWAWVIYRSRDPE